MRTLSVLFLSSLVILCSCQKEVSVDTSTDPDNGTGNGNCNNTDMKIKRIQNTSDNNSYVAATWNTDGTIKSITINEFFTELLTVNYIYAGGKIIEGQLVENQTGDIYDTVVYRYDAAGRVDSLHLKNRSGGIRLTYSNNRLVKLTEYNDATDIAYYFDVRMDDNSNVTAADEYMPLSGVVTNVSTFTYKREDRKNPFRNLAPYMLYLDDAYAIFRYWGNNNYTDQHYVDLGFGTGSDITSGLKYKYNSNCYPESSQTTILGMPVFPDPDFLYTYY